MDKMMTQPHAYPTLRQATWVWARIAALSFGGPAGQIAVMHRILVEEKRWLGDGRFLHALNFCMLLPGPEAQQLATYIGWLMHGVRGALIAGLLFILPGVLAIMGLSWVYAIWGNVGFVSAVFFGMKAAVLALVLQAVVRLGKRALKGRAQQGVAALSFAAIFAFGVPFPLIVAGAAVLGWSAAKAGWTAFQAGGGHGAGDKSHVEDAATLLGAAGGDAAAARAGAFQAGLAALALWLVPVGVLMLVAPGSVFTDIAVFFSQMAVLTFGGAYAVLAWVAQEAVGGYGWLSFMAALREAGWAEPLWAATLGGLLATWVTFAPCFAWIFLGAPFMERLRANAALASALATVTAAVVGVIVNLALWFAVHVIWQEVTRVDWGMVSLELPVLATVNWAAAGLTGLALWAVFGLRLGLAQVLGGAAAAGLGLHALGLV
jgi:chromate transporter